MVNRVEPKRTSTLSRWVETCLLHDAWTWVMDHNRSAVRGYRLEFHSLPLESAPISHWNLSIAQQTALDKEVQDLLDKRAVEPVSDKSSFFSPFLVVPRKDTG